MTEGLTPEYRNPRGLYPFQADHLADLLANREVRPGRMLVWDTGLGKSHAAMCAAALNLEDAAADVVVLVCEKVKLTEWRDDFARFTNLQVGLHHGPSRWKRLDKGWPHVLLTTYETGRSDMATSVKAKNRRGTSLVHGPLLDRLLTAGLKPMVIFDEADRLSNRSSGIYKSWEHGLSALRKRHGNPPVVGLTATPVRKELENAFNQLRLIAPEHMPLVGEFDRYFVQFRDDYRRPIYIPDRLDDFAELAAPVLLAKSKQDPDVREQFPAMTEESLWVDLHPEQRSLYNLVSELETEGALVALRQICAHPGAILHSATHGTSQLARDLVAELGEDWFQAQASAKTDRLVEYLAPVVLGQDDKAVVFSFFGPSVLPLLQRALKRAGMPVWMHDAEDGITGFQRASGGGVLLASDAAARGINLPQASYLVEYDMASTYGLRTQRLNRISRIGQGGPTATVRSMIVRDSVEVGLMHLMLQGNAQHDALLGTQTGEEYMTAQMRRQLLREGQRV